MTSREITRGRGPVASVQSAVQAALGVVVEIEEAIVVERNPLRAGASLGKV
jgi:hypothetical protein